MGLCTLYTNLHQDSNIISKGKTYLLKQHQLFWCFAASSIACMLESLVSISELILAAAFFLLALSSNMFWSREIPSKVSSRRISCSPTILFSFLLTVISCREAEASLATS